ncbi:MAG: ATP-dependent zinc metalloprotease FtsH [Planctomycetaceae bacterium]|jgi:cell division protease FtsH|nr:ATP-dependent zinc metalloprotease FtsH [Planctomycetaceae bacterium]
MKKFNTTPNSILSTPLWRQYKLLPQIINSSSTPAKTCRQIFNSLAANLGILSNHTQSKMTTTESQKDDSKDDPFDPPYDPFSDPNNFPPDNRNFAQNQNSQNNSERIPAPKIKPKKNKPKNENNNNENDENEENTENENNTNNSNNENNSKRKPKLPPQDRVVSIWLIIAIAIGAVLILSAFQPAGVEIPYSDFVKLIEQGPKPEAFIEVNEGEGKTAVSARYSNLDKIVVSNYEIRATVTREILRIGNNTEKHPPEHNLKVSCGRSGFALDDGKLLELLSKSGFKFRSEGYPSFLREHGAWLLFFAITVIIVFFLVRGLGNSGAMAFGRSRGKLITQEDIDITFNDVAGVDEAVDELKEIVAFLQTPERFQALGGRIPRGVLLVGPPGTGKTILAKAVAGEAGVPFFSLSGSDFVELYVGVGAARVRDLFEQAQHRHPSIIFIDELDALGKVRGGSQPGGHDERDQTLNALLVEMDGFSTNSGIIVMGATNRPEVLDPALLRPGRFDRQVLVDRPDLVGREAILKVHAKNVKLAKSIDLKEIASITSGFVGADLAALVNEAALLAARTGKKSVTMVEFNEAVERVTTGLQKKQRVIRPDEKKRIAVHECGHAIVAYFTPNSDPIHKVSIIPRGLAALGYTLQRPEDDRYLMTRNELEARIQTYLAGTIAEEMEFDAVSTGAQNDLEHATEIARAMVMDFGMSKLGRTNYRENPRTFIGENIPKIRQHSETTAREIDLEIRAILESMFKKAKELLVEKREILGRLTTRLLEKEVIENEELKEVIENALKPAETQTEETP